MHTLIFGTAYCDTPAKSRMTAEWTRLNRDVNPKCDIALVDSSSPHPVLCDEQTFGIQLGNNIGHLARGGQDGWGRAFCAGLVWAGINGYDYVAHVESDSLFRLPVLPICEQMHAEGILCASVPVRGTRTLERNWVETGLMFFDVSIVHEVVEQYDWKNYEPKRKYPQCPEWHVHQIVYPYLRMMPWSAERGDQGQITVDNVGNYDWITHVSPEVATAFLGSL